jgi:hypothetical protein
MTMQSGNKTDGLWNRLSNNLTAQIIITIVVAAIIIGSRPRTSGDARILSRLSCGGLVL